jgi:hypothetical protein
MERKKWTAKERGRKGKYAEIKSHIKLISLSSAPFPYNFCLGIKHPLGAYGQIFITLGQLQVCWCGALSLTTGRVCRLELLLALASAVIFGSESHGTRDHILLYQIRDFPFRRLLRFAGLRWGYSTPSPYGRPYVWQPNCSPFITSEEPYRNHRLQEINFTCPLCRERVSFHGNRASTSRCRGYASNSSNYTACVA